MDDAAFEQALARIRDDRVHGAGEIARECLRLVAESARGIEAGSAAALRILLRARAKRLAACRPSMAPVHNLMKRWCEQADAIGEVPPADARTLAAKAARALIEQSARAAEQAAEQLARHLGPGKTLLTHSLSSTIMALFERLAPLGVAAIVTESRPLNEGYLLAGRLGAMGVRTTLITDAQMGLFAAHADAAVVGADSISAEGILVNKAGTYLLALAARERGLPFYVCCESFKRRPPGMVEPALEEMDAAELAAPKMVGVTAKNVYFDITPRALISGWFDENGMTPSARA